METWVNRNGWEHQRSNPCSDTQLWLWENLFTSLHCLVFEKERVSTYLLDVIECILNFFFLKRFCTEGQILFLKTGTPKMSWFLETSLPKYECQNFCAVTCGDSPCSWATDLNLLCLPGISVQMSSWLFKSNFLKIIFLLPTTSPHFCSFSVWCFNPTSNPVPNSPLSPSLHISILPSGITSLQLLQRSTYYFPFLLILS